MHRRRNRERDLDFPSEVLISTLDTSLDIQKKSIELGARTTNPGQKALAVTFGSSLTQAVNNLWCYHPPCQTTAMRSLPQ